MQCCYVPSLNLFNYFLNFIKLDLPLFLRRIFYDPLRRSRHESPFNYRNLRIILFFCYIFSHELRSLNSLFFFIFFNLSSFIFFYLLFILSLSLVNLMFLFQLTWVFHHKNFLVFKYSNIVPIFVLCLLCHSFYFFVVMSKIIVVFPFFLCCTP